MARIDSLTINDFDSKVYVSYDDTDLSTDYFHAYNLCLKDVIRWIIRDSVEGRGPREIKVIFTNGFQEPEGYTKNQLNRLNKICRGIEKIPQIKREERIDIDGKKWIYTYAIIEFPENSEGS